MIAVIHRGEKFKEMLEQSNSTQEYTLLKRKKEKLQTDIITQTKNMREVDESIRCYLQEDIQSMTEELRETERLLFKLDENRKNNMVAVHDLEQTKERLLSFAEYTKDAQPEILVTLIRSIVERIYIVDRDDERYCHIFIKGCTGEDYTDFFQTAGYIEQNTVPVCDSEQDCICSQIQKASHIWTDQEGCRTNSAETMRIKRYGNYRSRSMPRPYSHANQHTAQAQCITNHGVSQRKKQPNDIRPAYEFKIQVRRQAFLGKRVLCGHGRTE